ncbi:MAG: type IV secretion system DNA-binding domain-containing protein, partial [Crenarchaeota archaeon]|nr:type IV secretion system DNA-binding domain-containing protein [Thermoproteota archaeon]
MPTLELLPTSHDIDLIPILRQASRLIIHVRNDSGHIRVILDTDSPVILPGKVVDIIPQLPRFGIFARLRRKFHHYVNDLSPLATLWQVVREVPGLVVEVGFELDKRAHKLVEKEFERRYRKRVGEAKRLPLELVYSRIQEAYPVFRKINENIYSFYIVVAHDDLNTLRQVRKRLRTITIVKWSSIKRLKGRPRFRHVKLIQLLKPVRNLVAISEVGSFLRIPGFSLDLAPKLQGVTIGRTATGQDVALPWEYIQRHSYVIGSTGSGKSTFLKLLVARLREFEYAPGKRPIIVVLDPHGDLAEELSGIADYYFVASRRQLRPGLYVNYSVNPLALPSGLDREAAIYLAVNYVVEIFAKMLRLQSTAVNVRYILQTILQALYRKYDNVTFKMLYEAIQGLLTKQLAPQLFSDDPNFRREIEALRRVREQSFISALTRLQLYANDPVLIQLTGTNTLDWSRIRPGSVIVFKLPKGELGEQTTFLAMSAIVLSIYYYSLQRAYMGQERIPFVVLIDEFQNVADLEFIQTILSESRKYGVHLVLAHQYLKQLDQELIDAVLGNTAVKIIFKLSSDDAHKFAKILNLEPSIFTQLDIGEAIIQLGKYPPFRCKIDYVEIKARKEPTPGFEPIEARQQEGPTLHPVLKYISNYDLDPLEQRTLYLVYLHKQISMTDLALKLGITKKRLETIIAKLVQKGYVECAKIGNRRIITYRKG